MPIVRDSIHNKKKRTKVLAAIVEEKVCYCKKIGGICMRCKGEWKQADPRPPGPSRSKSFRKEMAKAFKRYNQKKQRYDG